jgi:DNA adenine methylase
MGSKNRIAKDIANIINPIISTNGVENYLEPFVGGANMIEHIVCKKRYGLDDNEYLIAMWNALKKGWIPPKNLEKSEYESIRDNKENYPKEIVAIAGFCATYNAKWFGGYAGIVTTKVKTQRNYYDESVRNILKQVKKIKDVSFGHRKYQDINIDNLYGYVIYCDPPYENSTQYGYNFDHVDFWNWVRKVSKNNLVLISEYNAPEDFECIWSKSLVTTLDKNSRKNDVEKLFVIKKEFYYEHGI